MAAPAKKRSVMQKFIRKYTDLWPVLMPSSKGKKWVYTVHFGHISLVSQYSQMNLHFK